MELTEKSGDQPEGIDDVVTFAADATR